MHKIPKSIWALGFVSLFMDISSEIIHALLPVFLVSILGASFTAVGFLEGLAEAVVMISKPISGFLSDFFNKRKIFVFCGYAIGTISKPLFAIANSVAAVYFARLLDRIGKGIRGAPRDALIADLTHNEIRGRAYGLRQSLDTVGAFLGPSIAIFLMSVFSNNYKNVFFLATIPGLISLFLLIVFVPDKKSVPNNNKCLRFSDFSNLNFSYWKIVILGFIFKLAAFSEAFLILRAYNLGLKESLSPLIPIVMSIVYAVSAYPVGSLSDKINRRYFLLIGVFILIFSNLFLAFANSLILVFIGVSLWGLQLGFTQGTFNTLIADTCPQDLRGSAFGIFNLISAISLLISSSLAGIFWDKVGPSMPFIFSSIVAFIYCALQSFIFKNS